MTRRTDRMWRIIQTCVRPDGTSHSHVFGHYDSRDAATARIDSQLGKPVVPLQLRYRVEPPAAPGV